MSEVLYATDRARVVCGDARNVLEGLDTESADLVIVDPPYGVEWRSNRRAESFDALAGDGADERDGVRAILEQATRVVGQNRHLYVFGPGDVLEGLKVSAPVSLVWDKGTNGTGNLASAWAPSHEPIAFVVSKHRHAGQAGKDGGIPARLRKGSVLSFPRRTGRTVRHPTEKPVGLLAELVESSSRAGELVIDPCAGVGSTGVAALLRNRRALLIEIDPAYAQLAAARLRAAEAILDQAAAI